jgi:hypothetical protein
MGIIIGGYIPGMGGIGPGGMGGNCRMVGRLARRAGGGEECTTRINRALPEVEVEEA